MSLNRTFYRTLVFLITLLSAGSVYGAQAPKGIAGFSLGLPISECNQEMYSNYLLEKTVSLNEPFRKASIAYGNCKHEGRILRIKVKYADQSRDFFTDLHKKISKKYGDEGKWEGDSFGILAIRKWRFVDAQGNNVTLAIEFNNKNEDLSMGTVLKLSYPVMIEEERICVTKKQKQKTTPDELKDVLMDILPQ